MRLFLQRISEKIAIVPEAIFVPSYTMTSESKLKFMKLFTSLIAAEVVTCTNFKIGLKQKWKENKIEFSYASKLKYELIRYLPVLPIGVALLNTCITYWRCTTYLAAVVTERSHPTLKELGFNPANGNCYRIAICS